MAAKPLADLIDDLLAPALAAQGFAGRAIVSLWPEIVGERLAARTRPLKIDWPRRRPAPGEASEPATMVVLGRHVAQKQVAESTKRGSLDTAS